MTMFGTPTRAEAERVGNEALALLKTKGWKLRVWQNDGWHWSLQNHIISLHNGQGKFWALVSDDLTHVGTGAMLFCQAGHFEDVDPNVVVERAMANAVKVTHGLSKLVTEQRRRLAA